MVAELGSHVTAATMPDALRADVVILAVPFTAVTEAVGGAAEWHGRIVVDATNAIDFPAFTPKDLGGRPSTEIVAEAVSGARVVKAFNTLPAAVLARDPTQDGGHRVLFISGNDASAMLTSRDWLNASASCRSHWAHWPKAAFSSNSERRWSPKT